MFHWDELMANDVFSELQVLILIVRNAVVLLMPPSLLSWTIAGNVGTSCRAAWTCKNCSKDEVEVA